MDTRKSSGGMNSPSEEERREAARALGSARTPRKTSTSSAAMTRINEQRRAEGIPEELREKLREKQQARRERERQAKEQAAALLPPVEKKRAGRPRKEPATCPETTPKRGRGRPRKDTPQTTAQEG